MNFEHLVNNALYSDGILQTPTSKYFIHKIILSQSSVFRSLFAIDKDTYEIDLDQDPLLLLLNQLYNPSCSISKSNLLATYQISLQFELSPLSTKCIDFLHTLQDLDIYLEMARLSTDSNFDLIISSAKDLPVIRETLSDLAVTPNFSTYLVLLSLNSDLINNVDILSWTENEIKVALDDGVLDSEVLQKRLWQLSAVDPDATIKAFPSHRPSSADTLPDVDEVIHAPVALREVGLPGFLDADYQGNVSGDSEIVVEQIEEYKSGVIGNDGVSKFDGSSYWSHRNFDVESGYEPSSASTNGYTDQFVSSSADNQSASYSNFYRGNANCQYKKGYQRNPSSRPYQYFNTNLRYPNFSYENPYAYQGEGKVKINPVYGHRPLPDTPKSDKQPTNHCGRTLFDEDVEQQMERKEPKRRIFDFFKNFV